MDKKSTVRTHRDQIKENILQAAIVEFSLKGFNGASTQGIAARAGLKKSQLHYYIEDKENLYYQVLDTIFASWDALFEYKEERGDTPEKTLTEYITQKFEFAVTYPELSRVFTMEVMGGGPFLEQYWEKIMGSALVKAETINSWVKDNKIRVLDGRLLLMNIWALTQYYADYALQAEHLLKSPVTEPEQKLAIQQELITFILQGCGITD